jgi:hypothetical protein
MINRTKTNGKAQLLQLALLAISTVSMMQSAGAAEEENSWVQGTIVSVRGNILVVRPNLRPRLKRVAFGKSTQITFYEQTSRQALKIGGPIALGGRYNAETGLGVRWIEVLEKPIPLKAGQKAEGLVINKEGNYANGQGTLKSLTPFVFVDNLGKEWNANLSRLNGVWRQKRGDRNTLLIGTRISVAGKNAPDDVLQAAEIYPDRGQAPFGTMFGTITAVRGHKIEIRPRFTVDKLEVTLKPGYRLMRQVTLPEASIKPGQRVTFWGELRSQSGARRLAPGEKPGDLKALALLLGSNRLPSAQGANAPRYLSGQLLSLEPQVQLKLPHGQIIRVLPTAQMPIARLDNIDTSTIRTGQEAMFVLSRRNDGRFETATVILDASPWVGYGG